MTPTRTGPRIAASRGFAVARLLLWLLLAAWAFLAWVLSGPPANTMRTRINDLSVIPGAGLVMRDPTGVFYHVNTAGNARAIYPELAPPIYAAPCLDCTLVTGEQLSQTNDFCISGVRKTLPQLQFEIPCQTWAPLSEGRKVVGFAIFIAPLLLLWVLRALFQRLSAKRAGTGTA